MNSETLFTDYMSSARRQLEFYKMLGQKTLERLDEKSLHWQANAHFTPHSFFFILKKHCCDAAIQISC